MSERVPLVLIPFRSLLHMPTTRRSFACFGPPRSCSHPAAGSCSTSSPPAGEDIEETHGRWLEREPEIFERADWDEAARTLKLSVRRGDEATSFTLHWLDAPGWRGLIDEAGLAVDVALRLVRRPRLRRRRGHDLGLPVARRRWTTLHGPRRIDGVIVVYIILAILALLVVWLIVLYNRFVQLRNRVDNAWAQIEVQLKRRWDLIPNLIETVKGYAAHERGTFEAVTAARTAAQAASGPGATAAAEGILGQALGRLFAVAEAYPELQADENFRQLQTELVRDREQDRGLAARSTTTPCSRTTTRSRCSRACSSPAPSASRSASSSRPTTTQREAPRSTSRPTRPRPTRPSPPAGSGGDAPGASS